MEAYDSGAAVAWRRIRLFGCFNGAMSFDLQFSLFASTILPQKTLRKCWSYKCQLSYKSQVTCFRLISSPGIYPVLQSSFLHSELRYLQSADLWFCFLSPWRNGPEGSSTIVFLGEDRWDDHGLLLQVIWCSSCVIWGFSDSGSQQKRGRVDDHTRIRFLSTSQTTAPWELLTFAKRKERWSRGCGCYWPWLPVSRKAFVDVEVRGTSRATSGLSDTSVPYPVQPQDCYYWSIEMETQNLLVLLPHDWVTLPCVTSSSSRKFWWSRDWPSSCHLTALGPLSSCIYPDIVPPLLSRPYIYTYLLWHLSRERGWMRERIINDRSNLPKCISDNLGYSAYGWSTRLFIHRPQPSALSISQ